MTQQSELTVGHPGSALARHTGQGGAITHIWASEIYRQQQYPAIAPL